MREEGKGREGKEGESRGRRKVMEWNFLTAHATFYMIPSCYFLHNSFPSTWCFCLLTFLVKSSPSSNLKLKMTFPKETNFHIRPYINASIGHISISLTQYWASSLHACRMPRTLSCSFLRAGTCHHCR